MKYFFTIVWVLLFSILIALGTVQAQQLSLDWTKLPKTFVPNDVKNVHSLLLGSKIFNKKDEFETTAEFEKRFENLKLIKIGPAQTAADMLVFRFQDSDHFGMRATYNADQQVLSMGLQLDSFCPSDHPLMGHSMLGVSVPSVEIHMTREGLHDVKQDWLRGIWINNSKQFRKTAASFDLNAPRGNARQLKKDVAILVIGELAKPYTELCQWNSSEPPSLDEPYLRHFAKFYLVLNVTEIWFVNSRTGEIYKKVKVDS